MKIYKNTVILFMLITSTIVYSKEPLKVPDYMYEIFTCTHINTITFKKDKLDSVTLDHHADMFKLTITPKTLRWREFEEFTSDIDNKKTKFDKYNAIIITKQYPDKTSTFTMYKFTNQGIYTIISSFLGKTYVHNYDCNKNNKFKEKEKQEWYESDKR